MRLSQLPFTLLPLYGRQCNSPGTYSKLQCVSLCCICAVPLFRQHSNCSLCYGRAEDRDDMTFSIVVPLKRMIGAYFFVLVFMLYEEVLSVRVSRGCI